MKRELLIAIILTGLTAQAFAQPFVSMIPQPGAGGEKRSPETIATMMAY